MNTTKLSEAGATMTSFHAILVAAKRGMQRFGNWKIPWIKDLWDKYELDTPENFAQFLVAEPEKAPIAIRILLLDIPRAKVSVKNSDVF